MRTHLNKQQLAFILDIKAEDARAKMCVAWAKSIGKPNDAYRNEKEKIVDTYPVDMSIEILASGLNLPTLQESVNDIENNYLKRPASRKWILQDFPEKGIKLAAEKGKRFNFKIPPALKSLLNEASIKEIEGYWFKNFTRG